MALEGVTPPPNSPSRLGSPTEGDAGGVATQEGGIADGFKPGHFVQLSFSVRTAWTRSQRSIENTDLWLGKLRVALKKDFLFVDCVWTPHARYFASTRTRNCLPALKCGTNFPGTWTLSPDLGFLPMRGCRRLSSKLPNPRISMRSR